MHAQHLVQHLELMQGEIVSHQQASVASLCGTAKLQLKGLDCLLS